ncbi:hypothetical protein DFR70_108259 [Nocardia tenerifensis]|uniref:Uncharacterized protein n=1 Tax=Nocardia tenerifensis TaxID=228006 RepID=A0A318K144_9NOCA|nr:hypothetical protein [Nocardia tenerifensis]PXX61701.1 hypothetical protein DFR70_108259 [Nocardia tenerifensis]
MPEHPRIADTGRYADLLDAAVHDPAVRDGAMYDAAVYADAEPDPPETPDFETFTTGEAASRGGGIVVAATDSGLPTMVRVTPGQLRRDPAELAADVLRLCRLATDRAGLRRREYLTGLGLGEDALRLLGLPTTQTLERAELADEAEHEYEPRSWLDQDGGRW